ncbi:ubiquitin conjugating enzyme [Grosmannia clavigera kw1407]|uniref:Ubiquitin conjugating enzyme n=1 Tax=Grosmannia clavigera (strain kw1407 / UAMH 11150) TaxID=655863 RepID=F0XIH9_GROCL|nr:ubiquitin conjugating enzyme [Grosmannia clavigera kw1407]EFX02562.1 ubiquitin conjugating enzyme [Grosmannia clavigera kw1407]
MANTRSASRRLLRELDGWRKEQLADSPDDDNSPNRGIERLGPAGEGDDLFRWEAVVNGKGVGGGYDDGRWLLQIDVPATYPLQPPAVRFMTPILHANVHPTTGAVCLDLLQASAWTPAMGVAACVRAVRLLLGAPGADSPLNIDLAALLRAGDTDAAARLVRLWCVEQRYEGASQQRTERLNQYGADRGARCRNVGPGSWVLGPASWVVAYG